MAAQPAAFHLTVTWTNTTHGHHHATLTLPDGTEARLTYIPRGTAHTHLGSAPGSVRGVAVRATSLADMAGQYAARAGADRDAVTVTEVGKPGRPAR